MFTLHAPVPTATTPSTQASSEMRHFTSGGWKQGPTDSQPHQVKKRHKTSRSSRCWSPDSWEMAINALTFLAEEGEEVQLEEGVEVARDDSQAVPATTTMDEDTGLELAALLPDTTDTREEKGERNDYPPHQPLFF